MLRLRVLVQRVVAHREAVLRAVDLDEPGRSIGDLTDRRLGGLDRDEGVPCPVHADLAARVSELLAVVADRAAVIESLRAEVAALRRRAGRGSPSSSQPPGQDGPAADGKAKARARRNAIRGYKLAAKISGCRRTLATPQRHCRIRSCLATARSHDCHPLAAIRDALTGNPWMPPNPA